MNDTTLRDKMNDLVDAAAAVRDALTERIHDAPPQPETYSAEEAWEKMEQGYRVDVAGITKPCCWYMNEGGGIAYEGSTHVCLDIESWHTGSVRFTLHGIHPQAHAYALQRLKAAGMKVGSVVEVVDREWGDNDGGCQALRGFAPVGCAGEVSEIHETRVAVRVDESGVVRVYPAHCLKLPPQLKVGDRRWIEVEVAEDVEGDGEVMVIVPRRADIFAGQTAVYTLASALHATPGGGE